ncbi:MAG: DEAD/DEAH box helicase family protein [bacterium]
MKLKNLYIVQPLYFIPRDNFVGEVIIPCLKIVNEFRCMLGFFSSESLREIAPGLAEFLQREDTNMCLLISPYLSSKDQEALAKGINTPVEVLERRLVELFGNARVSESALMRHTLDCLAYLVATQRLNIKITLIYNALFHPKVWIFDENEDTLVAHGSVNMTSRGLTANYEHISIECSWSDSHQAAVVNRFVQEFQSLWSGTREDAVVIDLPNAIRKKLLSEYQPDSPPTQTDFIEAWQADFEKGLAAPIPESLRKVQIEAEKPTFHIPSWLRYNEGDFAHQGKAVQSWIAETGHGILEMATGSGKTSAAMISARQLATKVKRLLIVIAVPYVPLVSQWEEEVKRFGLNPLIPTRKNSRSAKFRSIEKLQRTLRLGLSDVECMIITHDLLCDSDFHKLLEDYLIDTLLIADEVHNLGRKEFIDHPPDFPSYRLGLSATPIRQYDEFGTSALFDYFGEVVFRFGLEEAIGKCLVPYEYYVHPINLTEQELDEWISLSEQLRKIGWIFEEDKTPSDYVNALLRKRRLILEKATSKIEKLKSLLQSNPPRAYQHMLIYATDKHPEQLQLANALIRDLGISFHQITAEETINAKLTGQIIDRFKRGELQTLTAKRVLDEGVNIPEVSTAFILASTTVERQWIQRRGRLLRKCPSIEKKVAYIHDFLVLPPETDLRTDRDAKNLIKSELRRILEFAKLAKNAASTKGPLGVVQPIYGRYFGAERN